MTPGHGLVHAKGDVVCTTASTWTYHQHNLLGIRGLQTLMLGQPPSQTFSLRAFCWQLCSTWHGNAATHPLKSFQRRRTPYSSQHFGLALKHRAPRKRGSRKERTPPMTQRGRGPSGHRAMTEEGGIYVYPAAPLKAGPCSPPAPWPGPAPSLITTTRTM